MKHLVRAGGVLIAILFVFFVLLRVIPVPESFNAYGFYREKENTAEWAARPMAYADPILCNQCHQTNHGSWSDSKHKTVSCENCHGPGQSHVDKGTPVKIDESREACAVCHSKLPSRPRDFPQVDMEQHGGKTECKTCHSPHAPAIPPVVLHPEAGYSNCLLCHSAGGLKPFPANHSANSPDSCTSCHSVKRSV
ncbi:MAG: hypothetical protein HYX79_00045 [Chloroflexi bacterium]|nr:hypothetical protein [Chloroflexota bacterium]